MKLWYGMRIVVFFFFKGKEKELSVGGRWVEVWLWGCGKGVVVEGFGLEKRVGWILICVR